MARKNLQLEQLTHKMTAFASLSQIAMPPTGWIKAIRLALGMSMQQLGRKMGITKQSVLDMEQREKDGAVTLKALREAATALDMQLVYGFVPRDGTLDALIERKAKELAVQLVMRTSQSMKLEEQENNKLRIERAIQEKTQALKQEMPKVLWD